MNIRNATTLGEIQTQPVLLNILYKYTECTETNKLAGKLKKLSIVLDFHCLMFTVLERIILLFCLNLLFKVKPLLSYTKIIFKRPNNCNCLLRIILVCNLR